MLLRTFHRFGKQAFQRRNKQFPTVGAFAFLLWKVQQQARVLHEEARTKGLAPMYDVSPRPQRSTSTRQAFDSKGCSHTQHIRPIFCTLVGVFTPHRTPSMAKILVAFDTVDEGFELIDQTHQVIRPPRGRDFTHEELHQLLPEADVLCTSFDYLTRAELLQHGSKLRLIANFGVGFNNIDIAYARDHDIAVTNTPQAVILPTAELTLALMLDCARRVSELDRLIRRTPGKRPTIGRMGYLGVHLAGKTLGLIGYGRIASAVAERARAFGMKILYNKRTPLTSVEETLQGITYASLDTLLATSDFISIHTPYSTDTHHFIGESELVKMKPTAIFINTARWTRCLRAARQPTPGSLHPRQRMYDAAHRHADG